MPNRGGSGDQDDQLLGLGGFTGRTLVVTCPKCRSRFEVNTKQLAGLSDAPTFHCSVCSTVFTADNEEDLQRIFTEARAGTVSRTQLPASESKGESQGVGSSVDGSRKKVDPNAATGEWSPLRSDPHPDTGQSVKRPAVNLDAAPAHEPIIQRQSSTRDPVAGQGIEDDSNQRVLPSDRESWSTMTRPISMPVEDSFKQEQAPHPPSARVPAFQGAATQIHEIDEFEGTLIGTPYKPDAQDIIGNAAQSPATPHNQELSTITDTVMNDVAFSSQQPTSRSNEPGADSSTTELSPDAALSSAAWNGSAAGRAQSLGQESTFSRTELTRFAAKSFDASASPGLFEEEEASYSSQLASLIVGMALLMIVPLAAFLIIQFNISAVPLRDVLPQAVQAPPSGLYVKEARFRKVTLEDGDEVAVISGVVKNDSDRTLTGLTLEGYLYSKDEQLMGSVKLPLGATITDAKLRSLTRAVVADLQKGKALRRVKLASSEEADFSIILLDTVDLSNIGSFGVRIYSAEYSNK